MQKRLHGRRLAIALSVLTFVPVAGFAANPAPAATPNPPQTTPGPTTQEKHPVMRRSINQLEKVREELQNDASRDFDGHRANAVKLIDQAIQQLQLGIQSDKH